MLILKAFEKEKEKKFIVGFTRFPPKAFTKNTKKKSFVAISCPPPKAFDKKKKPIVGVTKPLVKAFL